MNDTNDKEFGISRFWQIVYCLIKLPCFPLVDIFYKLLNRSKVIGRENIPKNKRGLLIASNHISGVDTLMIPIYGIRRFSFVPFFAPAKEELFKIPVVGRVLAAWGAFPVRRRARDINSMRRIAYYAKHYQVMLFPEGTRSKTGDLLKGRAGAGWVVYKARPTVIPTLVINTQHYLWPGKKGPWFGVPYTLVFGEPMDMSRFYDMPECKATSQQIVNAVMEEIAKLKEKHKDLYI